MCLGGLIAATATVPPSEFANDPTALVVGLADLLVAVGAGLLLVSGRRGPLWLRLTVMAVVAVALGATAVLATTLTSVTSGAGLTAVLVLLASLIFTLAGVAASIAPRET